MQYSAVQCSDLPCSTLYRTALPSYFDLAHLCSAALRPSDMVLVDAGCEFQVLLSLQQGVRMVHCGVQYKYIVRFLGTAQSTAGC